MNYRRPVEHAPLAPHDVKMLSDLLRHAYQRQRFPTETSHASPATFKLRDQMKELEQFIQILHEERSLKSSSKRKAADQAEDDAWERDMSEELHRLKSLVNPAHPAS
jgi:hypothetical protein